MLWTRYPRQWAQLVKLLPLNDYDDEVDELPDALVTCELCSKRFISARALAVHRSRAHGKKRRAPQLVDGSTCSACRTDFRPRLRLIHHLEYSSPKCLEVVASEVPPLLLERARELAAIDASQRRRAKKAGVSFLAAGVPCIPAPKCTSCTVLHVLSLLIQWSCSPGLSGFLVGSRVIDTVRFSSSKIKIKASLLFRVDCATLSATHGENFGKSCVREPRKL